MHPFHKHKHLAAVLPLLFIQPARPAQDDRLDPLTVTATRLQQRESTVLADITVIGPEEIRSAGPNVSLTELLARQPGVEFVRSGGPGQNSSLFIRGSNSNHVLLLVDGIRAGSVTVGSPTWEYIPLEQVDHIEILKGPASSLYGSDAIGGVVQIFTRRGQGPFQAFVDAGFGSYETSALSAGLSGAGDGVHYSLQVSDHRSDAFSAIGNPANPSWNPDRDGYRLAGSSGNLSWTPAEGQELGVEYLYSDGWNRYDGGGPFSTPASDDYRQKETIQGLSAFSRNRLTERWTSTLRIGQSSDDNRSLDNGVQTDAFRSVQNQYQWQHDVRLPVGTALLAAERVEQHVDTSTVYAQNRRTINSFLAGWTGTAGPHSLQANVRQDDNSQFGDRTSGLLAYGFHFTGQWRGAVSWGTAFKAPTFNDLYFPPDAYGDVGNPGLKPETSENREAALHFQATDLHASVTYYRNQVKDLIQWAPIDPTFITSYGYTPTNVSRATLSGWTFALSQGLGEYHLAGSVDLQDPRDDVLQKTLIYRSRVTAKLAGSRDFGAFRLGAELKASGKRFVDTSNTQTLGGYTLLSLAAHWQAARDWTLSARADNVLDRRYTLVQDYATPGASVFVSVRYAAAGGAPTP